MSRNPQLDGVRGCAVLMVLIWHYFTTSLIAESGTVLSRFRGTTGAFWSGVDLFFVLSGFLIAGILLDNRNASNYFGVFYFRRVCRIFPLYFLMLGLFVVGSTLGGIYFSPRLFANPMPVWSYALFVQNIFMGWRRDFGAHWLAMTWTLAIEEQFYLFVPLLIYFLPRKILIMFLTMAILAAPLLRMSVGGFIGLVNTPFRGDSLLSGALMAVFVRSPTFALAARRNTLMIFAMFIVLIIGAAIMTVRPAGFGVFNKFWLAGLYSTFVLLAYLGLLPVLAWRPLVWIGNVSYAVYMFHEQVNGLIHIAAGNDVPRIATLADAGLTLISLVITLSLAALSYRFLESPLIAIGHRARYERRENALQTMSCQTG